MIFLMRYFFTYNPDLRFVFKTIGQRTNCLASRTEHSFSVLLKRGLLSIFHFNYQAFCVGIKTCQP